MHSPNFPIAVTVQEARKMIGIGLTKFYELLNSGQIEAVKSGRQTLILTASLQKYIDNLPRRQVRA